MATSNRFGLLDGAEMSWLENQQLVTQAKELLLEHLTQDTGCGGYVWAKYEIINLNGSEATNQSNIKDMQTQQLVSKESSLLA